MKRKRAPIGLFNICMFIREMIIRTFGPELLRLFSQSRLSIISVLLCWLVLTVQHEKRLSADGFGVVRQQTRARNRRTLQQNGQSQSHGNASVIARLDSGSRQPFLQGYLEKREKHQREHRIISSTRNVTYAVPFNKYLQRVAKQNPEKAETALRENLETSMDCDTLSFNMVMNGWAQQRSFYAAQRAQALLTLMLQLPRDKFSADTWSYSAVMNALAKSGGGRKAALQCEALLKQAQSTIKLTSDVCHNAVIDAWSLSGAKDAGERAEQWLRQLESCDDIGPSRITYNAVLKAWSKSPNGGPRAQIILNKMLSHPNPTLAPDKISFTTTMAAWANSEYGHVQAAQRAEELLQQMESIYEESIRRGRLQADIRPDVKAYTAVLAAHAKSGSKSNGDDKNKAVNLLQRMERYAGEQPNSHFFNAWIHWLAKSGQGNKDSQAQAETILQLMKDSNRISPCKITYTAVISLYANQGTLESAQRAQELFDELENQYATTRQLMYLPNARTFAAVLNAWAKSGSTNALPQTNDLLHRMDRLYKETKAPELKPNKIVYSQIFSILSNCIDDPLVATQRAIELLEEMKLLYKQGLADTQPDATTYAFLVNTFTKAKVENAAELATTILREVEEGYANGEGALKPTTLLYSAVLQAYAKSASQEGAKLAEQLLRRTKELYKRGKLYAKPTVLYYNAVIDAHARSNGGRVAAERAETLLDEMESRSLAGDAELNLTTRSFNAALLAWKNSDDAEAPYRAEALLRRMNDKYKLGDEGCRPDQVTLNTIIACWAKAATLGGAKVAHYNCTAAERAEAFLNFLEMMFYEHGVDTMKPDSYSYNTVIDAYAKSGYPRHAEIVFQRMQKHFVEHGDDEIRPDGFTYTSLRNAWARSKTPDAPMKFQKIGELLKEKGDDLVIFGSSVSSPGNDMEAQNFDTSNASLLSNVAPYQAKGD